jgi:putative acyl-CoA dehydrogenase
MDLLERPPAGTHDVTNQPPPLVDYDVYASDAALVDAVTAYGAGWADPLLRTVGRRAGSEEAIAWGFEANANGPKLKAFDRYGRRIDDVEYHPSYHKLMATAVGFGIHASAWSDPRPGAHVARAAALYVWSQSDAGHTCPITMTHAVVPVLRAQPELARRWEHLIAARTYDGRLRPATEKGSAIFGMGMTEKQGGSDVRANTTRALPLGADTQNAFALQRLKDKLGNRSNASSEVEFENTIGVLVGEEGRGVNTIVEMVNFTRLDCAIGSASGMRQAVAQAIHHASHRSAFGKLLVDQPAMQNVLADLALESEAATLLVLRLASACDRASAGDEHEARIKRIGTAFGKFWVCKRGAAHAVEALECLGGNGYVEESIMPRLVRESPLNSIWEGSGNVNALDVLRAMARERGVLESYFTEVAPARGADARLDSAATALERELADTADAEHRARRIVERMALVFQGALVVRHAPPAVADAFCASRLGGDYGHVYGTLPRGVDTRAIVERAAPRERTVSAA